MRISKFHYSLLTLIFITQFTACSIVQVQKRHFRKGVRVHWNLNRTGNGTPTERIQSSASKTGPRREHFTAEKTNQSSLDSAEGWFNGASVDTFHQHDLASIEADNKELSISQKALPKTPETLNKAEVTDENEATQVKTTIGQPNPRSNWQFMGLLGLFFAPMFLNSNKTIGRSKKMGGAEQVDIQSRHWISNCGDRVGDHYFERTASMDTLTLVDCPTNFGWNSRICFKSIKRPQKKPKKVELGNSIYYGVWFWTICTTSIYFGSRL